MFVESAQKVVQASDGVNMLHQHAVELFFFVGVAIQLIGGELTAEQHREDLAVAFARQTRRYFGIRRRNAVFLHKNLKRLAMQVHIGRQRAIHIKDNGVVIA